VSELPGLKEMPHAASLTAMVPTMPLFVRP